MTMRTTDGFDLEQQTANGKTSEYHIIRARPDRFWLGKILWWHEIGAYQIVEYFGKEFKESVPTGDLETVTSFHVYVNKNDTNRSFKTLDRALLFAVAYASNEINCASWMADAAARVLGVATENHGMAVENHVGHQRDVELVHKALHTGQASAAKIDAQRALERLVLRRKSQP